MAPTDWEQKIEKASTLFREAAGALLSLLEVEGSESQALRVEVTSLFREACDAASLLIDKVAADIAGGDQTVRGIQLHETEEFILVLTSEGFRYYLKKSRVRVWTKPADQPFLDSRGYRDDRAYFLVVVSMLERLSDVFQQGLSKLGEDGKEVAVYLKAVKNAIAVPKPPLAS